MSDIMGERERDLAELESMLDEAENLEEEPNSTAEKPLAQQGKVKQPLMMDEEPGDGSLREEINACCNGLGKLDINDGVYMKDRDCKIFLREIVRFLSADKKRHVRMQLNELNIIDSDLIPLMVQYCDFNEGDPELFNLVIRICTTLTMPTFILFEEKIPGADDPQARMLYDKIHRQIGKYKESFANNEYVWSTLNTHLRHTNSEEDLNTANLHFERLIILIRNVLHIPTKTDNNLWDMGNNVHEKLLANLEKSGLLSTILQILCDSTKGSEYCFHLMEIIYYMLRDQNPKTIAMAERPQKARTAPQMDPDRQRYLEIRERARLEREASNKMAQYSRFKGSAFLHQGVRGIGNRPLVLNRPVVNETRVIDDTKTLVKKNKNRKPLDHKTSMEISDQKRIGSQVSYNLKTFCRKFVEQVYNTTMLQMKHNLIQKRAQEDDESTYLWAIQFFTSFSRGLKMPVELVGESLAVSTFHMINMLITGYQEKIKMEKKNFHTLTSRLHLALRAYREILLLIEHVTRCEPSYKAKADSIMSKLANEKDYANLLLSLFRQYSEPKHTLHYARDLIETNDVFIRLFEEYYKGELVKFAHFLSYYAHPDIITIYTSILLQYQLNDDCMNQLIFNFFEKLTSDCKCHLMLCQASVLRLLFAISEDSSRPLAGRQRSQELCKQLCRFYGELFNKRRWLIQELMYWKTQSDCISIENAIDPPPAPEVVIEREDLGESELDDIFNAAGSGLDDLFGDDEDDDDDPVPKRRDVVASNSEKLMEIPLSQLLSSSSDDEDDAGLARFNANPTGQIHSDEEQSQSQRKSGGGDGGDDDVNTSDNYAHEETAATANDAFAGSASSLPTEAADENARLSMLDEDSDS